MLTPLYILLNAWLGLALATDREVPALYPNVSAALAASRPGDTILLDDDDPAWDAALDTPLFVAFDLTIRSDDADRVQIPGVKVSSGATLTLEHVEVLGSQEASWTEDGVTTEHSTASIFVQESALRGGDIALPGGGEYGLLSVDSDVELSGFYASNFVTQRAVRAFAYSLPARLSLTSCDLGENAAGALLASLPALPSERASLEVTLSQCSLHDNEAAMGADILAHFATISLDTVHLDGGVATVGGGSIWAEDSDLSATSSTFTGSSAPYGASIVARSTTHAGADLRLSDVEFLNIVATDAATPGGVMRLIKTATTLEDVHADGIIASGGTLLYQEDGSFIGTNLHVTDFEVGPAGGALLFYRDEPPWNETATLTHSVFCRGFGVDAGDGLVLRSEGFQAELTNSVVQFNARETVAGVYISGAGANISQNTFTANDLQVFVRAHIATILTTNNIFDGVDYAVELSEAESSLSGGFNLWNDLTGYVIENGATMDVATGAVLEAPEFWVGFAPTDCDTDPLLAYGSPAIDAGDPEILDGDGTRSDIGAFGGPDIVLADNDGDGWRVGVDCDDEDSQVNPGVSEVWYDGRDADCAGGDDFDADLDGVDAEPLGLDCDDADSSIGPNAADFAGDGVDQDCDGIDGDSLTRLSGGCGGCASGGASAAWLGLLGLAILRHQPIRSRKSSGSRSGRASGSRS